MEKQVRLWGPFISKIAIWSTLASVKAWSWISFVYGVSDGKKRSPLVPVWQQTPRGFPSGLWAIWSTKYDLEAIEYQPWPNAGEKQADQTVGIRQARSEEPWLITYQDCEAWSEGQNRLRTLQRDIVAIKEMGFPDVFLKAWKELRSPYSVRRGTIQAKYYPPWN